MSFNALRARVEAGQDRLVIKNAALDHGEERVSLAGNVEARRGQPITIDARVQATEFESGRGSALSRSERRHQRTGAAWTFRCRGPTPI